MKPVWLNSIFTLRHAAEVAGVSHETIRTWCRDYGIGFQIPAAGVWVIDPEKLKEHMEKRTK